MFQLRYRDGDERASHRHPLCPHGQVDFKTPAPILIRHHERLERAYIRVPA